ncbi:MAG: amidohydrolase [Proteobacteria bacterium]|nr:amidohydrolase [Pseudomonadota bacterium]
MHTCTPYCRHEPSVPRPRAHSQRHFTVDFHCHALTPGVEALVAGTPQKRGERALQERLLGAASLRHNQDVLIPPALRRMTTVEDRLSDMDAMGVDLQVVSPSPSQYYYWAEEALAEEIVRVQNENIATLCAFAPSRLEGLGTVSLQHPLLAAAQAEFAVRKLGLRGIEISSNAGGMELADPRLEPFWRTVNALGCIVFLHPLGTSLGERVNAHYLSNLIGQPLETTIALSKLIFDGVLDRHPDIKLIAAHGGGYLPSYMGRTEHGSLVRPEAGAGLAHPPSVYLRRIWYDIVVHDPGIVRHLIDTVGASQLVVGTDYPFDMGQYDVHAFLAAVPNLSEAERKQILGENAARLLAYETGDAACASKTKMVCPRTDSCA